MVSGFEDGAVETVGRLQPIHDDPIRIGKSPAITRPKAFQTQPTDISPGSNIERDGGETVGTLPHTPEVAGQTACYKPPEESSPRIRPERVPSITNDMTTLGEINIARYDSDFDSDPSFGP